MAIDYTKSIYEIFVEVRKDSLDNIGALTRKAGEAQKQMDALAKEIAKLQKKYDDLGNNIKRTAKEQEEYIATSKRLAKSTAEFEGHKSGYAKIQSAIRGMKTEQNELNKAIERTIKLLNQQRDLGIKASTSTSGSRVLNVVSGARGARDTKDIDNYKDKLEEINRLQEEEIREGLQGQKQLADQRKQTAAEDLAAKDRELRQEILVRTQIRRELLLEAKVKRENAVAALREKQALLTAEKATALESRRQAGAATSALREQERQADRTAAKQRQAADDAKRAAKEQAAAQEKKNRDYNTSMSMVDTLRRKLQELEAAEKSAAGVPIGGSSSKYKQFKDQIDALQKSIAGGAPRYDVRRSGRNIQSEMNEEIKAKRKAAAIEIAIDRDIQAVRGTSKIQMATRIAAYEQALMKANVSKEAEAYKKLEELKKKMKQEGGKDLQDSVQFGALQGIIKGAVIGRIVREVFDQIGNIFNIYKQLLQTAFEFNVQLQETQYGLAAVIMQTQKITENGVEIADSSQAYTAAMGLAKEMQQEILAVSNRSILTFSELNDVMVQGSALLSARGVALEDQVSLTAQIVTAEKAIGVQQQQMFMEMRQLLSGDIVRGQLARQLVAAGKVSVDQLKRMTGRDLVNALRAALREFEIAGIRRMESLSGKWEVFTDTMKFQLASIFDSPALKSSLLQLMDQVQNKFFKNIVVNGKEMTVLTSDGKKLLETLTEISKVLVSIMKFVFNLVNSDVARWVTSFTVSIIGLTTALTLAATAISSIKLALISLNVASKISMGWVGVLIGVVSALGALFIEKLMASEKTMESLTVMIEGHAERLTTATGRHADEMTKKGDQLRKYYDAVIKYNDMLAKKQKLTTDQQKEFKTAVTELNKEFPSLISNTGNYTSQVDLNNSALSQQITRLQSSKQLLWDQVDALKAASQAQAALAAMEIAGYNSLKDYEGLTKRLIGSLMNLQGKNLIGGMPGYVAPGEKTPRETALMPTKHRTLFSQGLDVDKQAVRDFVKEVLNADGTLKADSEKSYKAWSQSLKENDKDMVSAMKVYLYETLDFGEKKFYQMNQEQQNGIMTLRSYLSGLSKTRSEVEKTGIAVTEAFDADKLEDAKEQLKGAQQQISKIDAVMESLGKRPVIKTEPTGKGIPTDDRWTVKDTEALSDQYYLASSLSDTYEKMAKSKADFYKTARKEVDTDQVDQLLEQYARLDSLWKEGGMQEGTIKNQLNAVGKLLDEIWDRANTKAEEGFRQMWANVIAELRKKGKSDIADAMETMIGATQFRLTEQAYKEKEKALEEKMKDRQKQLSQIDALLAEAQRKGSGASEEDITNLRTQRVKALQATRDIEMEIVSAQVEQLDTTKEMNEEARNSIREGNRYNTIQSRVVGGMDEAREKLKQFVAQWKEGQNAPSFMETSLNRIEGIFGPIMEYANAQANTLTAEFEKGIISADKYGDKMMDLDIKRMDVLADKKKELESIRAALVAMFIQAVSAFDMTSAGQINGFLNEINAQIEDIEASIIGLEKATLSWQKAMVGTFGQLLELLGQFNVSVPQYINGIYGGLESLLKIQDEIAKGEFMGGIFDKDKGFGGIFSKMFSGGIGNFFSGMMGAIPVVGAFASIFTGLFSGLSSLFTRAAKQIAKEMREELSQIMTEYEAGNSTLVKTLEMLEEKRLEAISRLSGKKGGQKELESLLPEFDKAIADLKKEQQRIFESFEDQLKLLRLEEYLRDTQSGFDNIIKTFREYVDAGGDIAKANEYLSLSFADMRRELQEELDQELKDAEQARQYEIDNWMQGAEDELGRLISKEQQALNEIEALRTEYAKNHADRMKQIADEEEKLAETIRDKEKQIQDIKNEGLAERRKSTIQDKLARIAAIQDEMTDERNASAERIQQIKDEDEADRQRTENEITRINNVLERERQAHIEAMNNLDEESQERIQNLLNEIYFLNQLIEAYYALADAANSVTLPPVVEVGTPGGGNPPEGEWGPPFESYQKVNYGGGKYNQGAGAAGKGGNIVTVTVNVNQANSEIDIEQAVITGLNKALRRV